MNKHQSLQDLFIEKLYKIKSPVSVFLCSGIQLKGIISSFDRYTFTLENETNQLVYKHAISTVVPTCNIDSRRLMNNIKE